MSLILVSEPYLEGLEDAHENEEPPADNSTEIGGNAESRNEEEIGSDANKFGNTLCEKPPSQNQVEADERQYFNANEVIELSPNAIEIEDGYNPQDDIDKFIRDICSIPDLKASDNSDGNGGGVITSDVKSTQILFKCPFCFLVSETADGLSKHLLTHLDQLCSLKSSEILATPTRSEASKDQSEHSKTIHKLPPCKVVLTRCDRTISSNGQLSSGKTNSNLSFQENGQEKNSQKVQAGIGQNAEQLPEENEDGSRTEYSASNDTTSATTSLCGAGFIGNSKTHQCPLCAKSFSFKQSLNCHLVTHTGEKAHKCETCSKAFSAASGLRRHIRLHHLGLRPHKCSICSKGFDRPSYLKQHIRMHSKEKPFKCPICFKGFSRLENMKVHTGALVEGSHGCKQCSETFISPCQLRQHQQKTHRNEKRYKCGLCPKRFSCPAYLNEHMRTHTGNRPFQCPMCPKCFHANKDLLKHIRIHTKERPYLCGICDKGFMRASHLKIHARVHTGEKPFECQTCSKKFKTSQYLALHLRTHETDRRMYNCPHCYKQFVDQGYLRKHIAKIHVSAQN